MTVWVHLPNLENRLSDKKTTKKSYSEIIFNIKTVWNPHSGWHQTFEERSLEKITKEEITFIILVPFLWDSCKSHFLSETIFSLNAAGTLVLLFMHKNTNSSYPCLMHVFSSNSASSTGPGSEMVLADDI